MTEIVPSDNTGEFIMYQTEDGLTKIEARQQDGAVMLTQAQMAELFQTTKHQLAY